MSKQDLRNHALRDLAKTTADLRAFADRAVAIRADLSRLLVEAHSMINSDALGHIHEAWSALYDIHKRIMETAK